MAIRKRVNNLEKTWKIDKHLLFKKKGYDQDLLNINIQPPILIYTIKIKPFSVNSKPTNDTYASNAIELETHNKIVKISIDIKLAFWWAI